MDLHDLEQQYNRLQGNAESMVQRYSYLREQERELCDFLERAPKAERVLESLTNTLFGSLLDEIEINLTHGIREVLGQERIVSTIRTVLRNKLNITFQIQNQGDENQIEDVMTGQGGSVCNILSVGLRLIALSQLPTDEHRPFLVLDEQDCWLKPALVPKFMQIISQIAKRLNIQVLVISHHPLDGFSYSVDRIYELHADREMGARIEQVK